MATITTREITDKDTWETFIAPRPEANFLQSWYWGEFHLQIHKKVQRTGFYDNDTLVGVMLSIVEDAKRGRYLTVPGGPIIEWNDKDCVAAFVTSIRQIAEQNSCVFVRVRPQCIENNDSINLFRSLGFVEAPMHLHAEHTSQLDITKNEEELMSAMRKNTRYEVKKAQKEEIVVTSTTDSSAIKAFYDLQIETARRHGFVPFSYDFLLKQFEVFAASDKVLLYSAHINNDLLAQAFVIFYGTEAAYHYGASTLLGRSHPGAYLIQWEAICEAKRRGMKRYNFWGVVTPEETNHRFYGVSVFKRGFGGEDVNYLHAQDLIMRRVHYKLSSGLEYIRKKIRRV